MSVVNFKDLFVEGVLGCGVLVCFDFNVLFDEDGIIIDVGCIIVLVLMLKVLFDVDVKVVVVVYLGCFKDGLDLILLLVLVVVVLGE